MALGDLSADQARFAAGVAARTGLDPTVVAAWVGSESGWGVTKPDHNYLNVGPGEAFTSPDVAAARVSHLITSTGLYGNVKAAVPAGPLAQVHAIEASPWDANHYGGGRLETVFTQLHGAGGAQVSTDPVTAVPVGFAPLDWAKNVFGWITNPAGAAEGAARTAIAGALQVGLTLLLAAAGVGLVVMGLNRLTGRSPAELFGHVQSTVNTAGQAAALAAIA